MRSLCVHATGQRHCQAAMAIRCAEKGPIAQAGWHCGRETKRPKNALQEMLLRFVTTATFAFLCVGGLGSAVLSAERVVADESLLLAAAPGSEATAAQAPQPIPRAIQRPRAETAAMAPAGRPHGQKI